MPTVTRRNQLVQAIMKATGVVEPHAEVILDTMLRSLCDALQRGDQVELRGFGTFYVRTRKAKMHRDAHRRVMKALPETKRVAFRPGEKLLTSLGE